MILLAGTASAEKGKSKSVRERAAKKACALGDFQKGAEILTDLLLETNDSTYIYNQARCYQQNNRWDQAISRFREYLRKAKDLSESDRSDTERQISDCEASLGKTSQVAPPPAAVPPLPAPVVPVEAQPSQPEATTPVVSSKPTPPSEDGTQGKGLRTAGIVCAIVGVAAVGTGVGLAVKTQSISSDEQKYGPTQAKEDQRKRLETLGWVGYGVGAAAIATGVILYVAGWPTSSSNNVALLPVVAPDGASVTLQGSF
jgi:tetratricopeptide (TPR) repeat protein